MHKAGGRPSPSCAPGLLPKGRQSAPGVQGGHLLLTPQGRSMGPGAPSRHELTACPAPTCASQQARLRMAPRSGWPPVFPALSTEQLGSSPPGQAELGWCWEAKGVKGVRSPKGAPRL